MSNLHDKSSQNHSLHLSNTLTLLYRLDLLYLRLLKLLLPTNQLIASIGYITILLLFEVLYYRHIAECLNDKLPMIIQSELLNRQVQKWFHRYHR